MPTLMGFDSDDERSFGEVGREGVAIDHVDDLHAVFQGIDIGSISISMTINPTAWILLAMLLVVAEERGLPGEQLAGTTQADIIKEFIAQKEWIYPVEPSLRIVRDMITFSAEHLPHWNPVNISGYHTREAGATAAQEVAFTLAAGIAYAEQVMATGMPFDDFAPRFSFYFISHSDFLEEVAKFRAARRLWAKIARERFGARKPESMRHALPLPDGRLVADGTAAAQQHRPRVAPGARCGLRRRAVAARERDGRGARDPLGAGDEDRTANAADHPRGDGRRLDDRRARRLVRGGGVDRGDRTAGARSCSARSTSAAGRSPASSPDGCSRRLQTPRTTSSSPRRPASGWSSE